MTLTVVCVWVQIEGKDNKRRYGRDYVQNLFSMVSRNLDRPFNRVCLTNLPTKLPGGIRAIPIKPLAIDRHYPPLRGWWNKVQLFNPKYDYEADRVLYLDLDLLIMDELDPIIDFPAPFAACADNAPGFKGGKGLKVVKKFNSSIMVWDREARPTQLFKRWSPAVADRLWGDQDWLGEMLPNAAMFPKHWMTRVSVDPRKSPPFAGAKVITCTKTKNHELVNTPGLEWVRNVWYGTSPIPSDQD